MDDETAEIELLEQNLNKTRHISQRMTATLTSFDSRLVKLEKSILPLYNATQLLTRRRNNIESALEKINEIVSNQEIAAAEEALILRGPQPGEFHIYKDTVERMNAGIAFKNSEIDSERTASLIDTAVKKLSQMFTTIVAEGSTGAPPGGPGFEVVSFPADLLSALKPLVAFLRSLPLPASHPSHPSAPSILNTLKGAQRGYADMRGKWCRRCLEPHAKRLIERVDTLEGIQAGHEIGQWASNFLNVVEEEYNLLLELVPLTNKALLASTFSGLLAPLGNLFSTTMGTITANIKRMLVKYTFLALATFSDMFALQSRWDKLVMARSDRKENEFKETVQTLRSLCIRSFPELLAEIKMTAQSKGDDIGTGVIDFNISTIKHLEHIPELKETVMGALVTLGDGNWKMGTDQPKVATAGAKAEVSEQVLLEHYLFDVVTTLVNSLTTLSRAQRRPAFGSIFLLNNIAHLRSQLLRPRAPLYALLPRPTQDLLNSNFRTAKAAYFDSNFSPLMQALADDKDKLGGGSRAATKEKFTRFFDLLEETKERHKLARVLDEDEDNREMLADEVVRLVVPNFQRFAQKNKEKEFSKNPSKYIKMTPLEVEQQIRSFYT